MICHMHSISASLVGRGRVKPISIPQSSEIELDMKLKKEESADNENEMEFTSTLTEPT